MKNIVLIFLVTIGTTASNAGNIPPRVESFLQKVELYYDNHPVNWTMPNLEPPAFEMPSPMIAGMMTLDPETGLAFSASTQNLYDPELEIGLEAKSGTVVDFKTGEKYSVFELLKNRAKRKKV